MKTLVLIGAFLAICGMWYHTGQRSSATDKLLNAHYQAASDSLTVATVAIAVYQTEARMGHVPERSALIGTVFGGGNQPFELWDLQDASRLDQPPGPIVFRGTSFNLYTGRSRTGHLIVYYQATNASREEHVGDMG